MRARSTTAPRSGISSRTCARSAVADTRLRGPHCAPRVVAMRVASLLLLAAATARAHIVPVPPSTCAFDPVTVEMPAVGLIATGAPPAPGDTFHILYDPQASAAQFNLTGVPPRSFGATGVMGSFSVSPIFGGALA